MKKNLALFIFGLLEIIFVIIFAVPQFRSSVINNTPFLYGCWNSYKALADSFAGMINLDQVLSSFPHRLTLTISLLLINILIIIVYETIAFIIQLIIRKNHKKNLVANKLDTYELTEEEKARFSWKLYQKHFPLSAIVSFLIPTLLILFLLLLRFDKVICINDIYKKGFSTIYSESISPFINSFFPSFNKELIKFIANYISMMNGIIDIVKISWIEYVIIVITFILIYLIWFLFVWIFSKMFKKTNAKRRAKRAKKKYIAKMEKIELKARKDAGQRISSKTHDLKASYDDYNVSLYEDASIISIRTNKGPASFSDAKNAEYIDDISTGVIDLGIASSTEEEEKEPIEKKIPIFVGEEDVDIVLEKEPVIETIEEEEEDYFNEEEPFFEKYEPDNMDFSYLDESLLITQVEVFEEGHEEEKDLIIIKQFEETEKQNINFEMEEGKDNYENSDIQQVEDLKEEIINLEIENSKQEKTKAQDEVNPDEIVDEKNKEEIKPLKFEPKKSLKKPIKPISLNEKYPSNERFKNAKSKYFKLNNKDDLKKKEMQKKRNLRRRKH